MTGQKKELAAILTLAGLGLYSAAVMISDCRSRDYEQQLQEPRVEKIFKEIYQPNPKRFK